MPITVLLIVILFVLAIGFVFWRSLSKENVAPNQAPSPLRNKRLQAKTDMEAALEFEAYKQKKETSVDLLQHEIKEKQRKLEKQYHSDFERVTSEIQSKLIHTQRENQIQLKKANEKMQDWTKNLWHTQRKELQEFFQKSNDKIKQDIQSEIRSTEQHVQREIRLVGQSIKEEILKTTLKAIAKAAPIPEPKAMTAEISKEPITENLEKHLNHIEMTENQIQTNIFNELKDQLVDAQNTMKQIDANLEMLQLLHALECEFKNQALSMSE